MTSINPKYFDSIRIKPKGKKVEEVKTCQWEGCSLPATNKAPKGRGQDGIYINFCMSHVREYNKSYNYFEGMNPKDVSKFQKESLTGNRPTWKLGVENAAEMPGYMAKDRIRSRFNDKVNALEKDALNKNPVKRPKVGNAARKAFGVLGLDTDIVGEEIKNKYKILVKRHHPDANGGTRDAEDRLVEIIKSYRYLKSAGFC